MSIQDNVVFNFVGGSSSRGQFDSQTTRKFWQLWRREPCTAGYHIHLCMELPICVCNKLFIPWIYMYPF